MPECIKDNNRFAIKKVCFVATIEMTVKAFLMEHIRALGGIYDVCVIANTENADFLRPFGINVKVIPVVIERKISLWNDLKALFCLYRLFRQERFDVVHSIMPKSGLLSMAAGFLARVPNRIHTFTGQVWATQSGLKRSVLKFMDRLLVFFAVSIFVDSNSQRKFLISEGIVSEDKAFVLASGSIAGVDTQRFRPDPQARNDIRSSLGITDSDIVFLFLGRLTRDKGLLELAGAFLKLCTKYKNIHLMVVGPDEDNMRQAMTGTCGAYGNRLHFEDYTDIPEAYMAAADVFCLPSYREGFGSVIIEAAAVGVPAVGTRIYGITDAIDEGVTGLLCAPRDPDALAGMMEQLAGDDALRKEMGASARARALRDYSKETVVSAMLSFYASMTTCKKNEAGCS